jgi:hypothetical protein
LITQVKHLPARREEAKTKIDGREVAITVLAAVAVREEPFPTTGKKP